MDHPTTLAPSQPEQARGPKPDSQGRAERVHRGNTMTTACFVGIDVSKGHLDLHARPDGSAARYTNDPTGIAALLARVAGLAPERIVLEATGGFEAAVAAALAAAGRPVAVVNPRQVRDFARATGRLAKTDALDAAVLAHFAEAVRPEVRALPGADAVALAALVDRRRQLIEMRTAEMNRLGLATPRVATSVRAHIAWLSKQLDQVDKELAELIEASPVWREGRLAPGGSGYRSGGEPGTRQRVAGTGYPLEQADRVARGGGADEPRQRSAVGPPRDHRRARGRPERPIHGDPVGRAVQRADPHVLPEAAEGG